jgi:hypothetical protein
VHLLFYMVNSSRMSATRPIGPDTLETIVHANDEDCVIET